ncbi:MAG: mRNA surveillance protein pelota [Candidatus Altiarchaeales archaeon]|nr:MAG: mRNA surveillance protein pelota [Candidatus Altiarchaeales archaeon]HDO82320.1 mRNA surveillance protein pelota [Candidatus Altiarchaeales archaeon]HEX54969.1 mRNA surveillance protein pelota [Candidatus Altiarchaeales archaeon]
MKILSRSIRRGIMRLRVENLDDLWYLSNIIHKNDLIRTRTERRIRAKDDTTSKKSERIWVNISLRVKKLEFKSDYSLLRISGIIENAPEEVALGSHHTLNIGINSSLTIIKDRWSKFDLEYLRESEKASLRPKILIVVVDFGEATIGLVRESRIDYFEISKHIGGKYDTEGRERRRIEFYHDVCKLISEILKRENISIIILAGAGFEKNNLHKFISENSDNYPDLNKKIIIENIGSSGRTGISEVMRRPRIKDAILEIEASRDLYLVNRILEEIAKDSGLAVYSLRDVEESASIGAIEIALINSNFFRENRERIDRLLNIIRGSGGRIHIVNYESDAGKQLNSLGGIAALLRFRVK